MKKVGKLLTPKKKELELVNNERVVYWADIMFTFGIETIEQEWKELVCPEIEEFGIEFGDVKYTNDLPLTGEQRHIPYDILFFDWGGMSMGNSMLDHFCKYILEDAVDHPSVFYVMVSSMTKFAMKDAIEEFGPNIPANIFLSVPDFMKYYKKFMQVRSRKIKEKK